MKRSPRSLARHPRSREPFGQNIVSQRDDVVSGREDVAMHVADQVADSCRFGQIARMGDQHILVCSAHHIRNFGIVVQELPRVKDRARRQFQCEYDAVGRLEEPPNAPGRWRSSGVRRSAGRPGARPGDGSHAREWV